MPEGNRVVMVSAPQKPGVTVPDEATMAAAIKAAASKPITAYADTTTAKPLFSATPKAGTVTKTNVRADVGVIEWTLSNGVKVILKPTTYKQDEVVFRAFSPGGTSLAPDADLISVEPAAAIISSSGIGSFSRIELGKMLAGKIAGVAPEIGPLDEGLRGSASVKDLETMFQLIYMTFTEPRLDRDVFTVMRDQTKMMLGNMRATPNFAFSEALNEALTQNHPRERTPTQEMIDKMDADKALAFYKDRFADASDFTFVFVGSFDPAALQPLAERYLASLPSIGRKETFKDHNVRTPSTVVERKVEKGLEPQSHSRVVFTGPFRVQPAAAHSDSSCRVRAADATARDPARRPRGDVQRLCGGRLRQVPDPGIQLLDRFRQQPRSCRGADEACVRGDRGLQGQRAHREAAGRRQGRLHPRL
jgi:zinc protease